jgi:hypothetical protein
VTACVVALLFSVQGSATRAQTPRSNTWTATSSTGRTFAGTWTAVADQTSGGVRGTWTLVDARGRSVTGGVWSATKSPAGWTGRWIAAIAGSKAAYSGTWSAGIQLKANAPLAELFAAALQSSVGGNWRTGGQSGTWSIRAFQQAQ